MKTKPISTTPALLAAFLVPVSLHAIEAPEDNAPPPAQAAVPAAKQPAFLGIITERVPQALRDHLNLAEEQGVIISNVVPDGPAAKAGLTTNEIITQIGDTKITNPAEVSALIAKHKPGDEIAITTILKGKTTERKATLGERPAHLPMAQIGGMRQLPALEGMPEELAERIRRMVEDNAMPFEMEDFPLEPAPAPGAGLDADELRQKLHNGIQQKLQFHFGMDGNGIQAQRQAIFRSFDAEGSIEMKSQDDSKEVTVLDKNNNVVWNGPWDTEQDKAAAPDDIRERIERSNFGGRAPGIRLNINPR